VLVEGLEYADGDLRWSAARALVDLARLHPEAHGVLLGLARADRTPSTRRMALHALRQLAPDDAETAAALIEASRALEPSLQRSALTALAGLLSPPPAVLERLHEARNAEDPTTRRIAELAIERLAAPRTR
jgi:HEAT repeat protein